MRLRKRPQEVVALTNVAGQLVGTFAQGKHHALAHVDPLGVIERLRFEDVRREAAQWAGLLREQGVKPGDRVVVLAERDRHWRCALLGVLQAGGVAVPCPSPAPIAELRAIAEHAGAEIVDVEYTLDPAAELELLDRFHPAAVWFSDAEYAELASLGAPAWVDLGSTRRALTSDDPADGAIAFQEAIGPKASPV